MAYLEPRYISPYELYFDQCINALRENKQLPDKLNTENTYNFLTSKEISEQTMEAIREIVSILWKWCENDEETFNTFRFYARDAHMVYACMRSIVGCLEHKGPVRFG